MSDYDINLNDYPQIKTFLNSEPADVTLLGADIPLGHVVKSNQLYFSLFELCCLLGKHTHITALFGNETDKRLLNNVTTGR